tara:strand:+ start:607 stop:1248 length:642 start_codon:yes stop_codon:yes gene_type:complete
LKKIIITIDGPAGSGKGRIAKFISRKWNLTHLDSGIIYRRIALKIINSNVDYKNQNEIRKLINSISSISIKNHKSLRTEIVSKITSKIAVFKVVRDHVNRIQKEIVYENYRKKGFVIDGRDIGSVVFRDANLKLYIIVNAKIRAERRYKQLIDIGEQSIYQKIFKEINLRDKKDKSRKNSPLIIPKGAYLISNEDSFRDTVKQINKLFENINE